MNTLVIATHVALATWLYTRQRKTDSICDQDGSSKPVVIQSDINPSSTTADGTADNNPYMQLVEELSQTCPFLSSTPLLPPPLPQTPCTFVDTLEQLQLVSKALSTVNRIAIDLEHHSEHSYFGLTCLVQISTGDADYLIDAVALKKHIPSLLGPTILSNPQILKIVHGGGSDVVWLLRDFGIRLVNIFDTEKALQCLGRPERSLQSLMKQYCSDIVLDKSLQRADWRVRPLPPEMIEYARSDVHYLLYLADCLGQELLQHGKERKLPIGGIPLPDNIDIDPNSPFGRALQRSHALTLSDYAPPNPAAQAATAAVNIMREHISGVRSLHGGFAGAFNEEDTEKLEKLADRVHVLCLWRDATARELDDGVECVLPDAVVLDLVVKGCDSPSKVMQSIEDAARRICSVLPNSQYCKFPSLALDKSKAIAKVIREKSNHTMWRHPDVRALLKAQNPHGANKRQDDDAYQTRLGEKFGVKKEVYENCQMYSASGDLLCYTDKKRLLWYLRKGLAEEIHPGAEPLAVRLLFQHKEDDQRAGAHEFYSAARANQCVSCGSGKHYLRYRVVPSCYRKAMPVEMKSHRSHDVLLLCLQCHEIAQSTVEKVKRQLAAEFAIPLFPPLSALRTNLVADGNIKQDWADAVDDEDADSHPWNVRKAAIALLKANDLLPAERKEELQAKVSRYVRIVEPWLRHLTPNDPFTIDECYAALLAGMTPPTRRKNIRKMVYQGTPLPQPLLQEIEQGNHQIHGNHDAENDGDDQHGSLLPPVDLVGHGWHGRMVVETAYRQGGETALSELCARFRRAFVDALRPQHLPAGWKVEHTAPRAFGDYSIYHGGAALAGGAS